jgi:hypothetical protein
MVFIVGVNFARSQLIGYKDPIRTPMSRYLSLLVALRSGLRQKRGVTA